jgi:hypothetical protein
MLRLKIENSDSVKGSLLTQNQDYRSHPLANTDVVTIEMEHDEATKSFVTFVKELHGMSANDLRDDSRLHPVDGGAWNADPIGGLKLG